MLLNQAGLWLFSFLFLSPTIIFSGLPVCNFKCLTNKEIIHKGAYGTLFTADWQTLPGAGGKSAAAEKVVAKKLLDEDILDKKTFVKEGRIIQELKHPNIVKFKGICNNPLPSFSDMCISISNHSVSSQKLASLQNFLVFLSAPIATVSSPLKSSPPFSRT